MTQKFCLKWNDFDSNVSKSFGLLRNEEYLHDVTIVGDDKNQVSAHKLVLSSCSEYFRNIFKNNKHIHPLLCIGGIASVDLNNIMNYIYNGEVNIFQDELDRFLQIAQRLKLNGLIGNEVETGQDNKEVTHQNHEQRAEGSPTEEQKDHIDNNVYSPIPQKQSRRRTRDPNPKNEKHTIAINGTDHNEIDTKIFEYLETLEDGSLKCTFCGKIESNSNVRQRGRTNIKNHVETHLDGISFSCQLCGKEFRSRNSLSVHKSQNHKDN